MKILFYAAILSLISNSAFASCDGLGGQSKTLSITIGECEGEIFISHFTSHVLNGKPSHFLNGKPFPFEDIQALQQAYEKDLKTYRFIEECTYKDQGFTCRADGHTPLAGTTWKFYSGSNIKNGKPKCNPVIYECVKGCQGDYLPKELSGTYEQSKDGECEE